MIRVMIVEDDPLVAEFNRLYLEQVEGFVMTASARSAHEALLLLEQREVDLILLDVYMPGMNGLEFLTTIRKKEQDVDVIVVSAACDNQSVKKALRYGALDYLVKPFEFERLSMALTAYRDGVYLMRKKTEVTQTELDRRIMHKNPLNTVTGLPKGIDRNTLKSVLQALADMMGSEFTTQEMADKVGVSRVSMRKYLEFLLQLKLLKLEVIYGAVGRPVFKYRFIDSETKLSVESQGFVPFI